MPARPGPTNTLCDVAGLKVGHAEDWRVLTGVTAIVPDRRTICAVDVRGGAPGTRETDALGPDTLVDAVDAVILSGGSVFGLDAASGAVAALAETGRGYKLLNAAMVAPVVPAAILFDLTNGGDKAWGPEPPYRLLGREAVANASAEVRLGNAGAGLGAKAGSLKGGLGSASTVTQDGFTVAALIAVNAFGSVLIPGTRSFWAWTLEQGGEFGRGGPPRLTGDLDLDLPPDTKAGAGAVRASTTIGAVATDAALTPAEAQRLAKMAQDGLAMAIRPIHTMADGDALFALATGEKPLPEPRAFHLSRLGMMAADAVARAVARGVFLAESTPAMTAFRDLAP
jgi:L-aminopeptidase/D-esterase-like protein